MAGVPLATVQTLLGHKSLQMVLRYAHLSPGHISQAVEILDKTYNSGPTSHLLHNRDVSRVSVGA
jgi:hypothetical protein